MARIIGIDSRGARGQSAGDAVMVLEAYEQIQQASSVPHDEVVAFVRARRLFGRGIGWIDTHLLASAVVDRLQVWTADPRFATAAQELGVAYAMPSV